MLLAQSALPASNVLLLRSFLSWKWCLYVVALNGFLLDEIIHLRLGCLSVLIICDPAAGSWALWLIFILHPTTSQISQVRRVSKESMPSPPLWFSEMCFPCHAPSSHLFLTVLYVFSSQREVTLPI